MALRFGKTLVPHFTRVFYHRPRQLTLHPYLNFLRSYKFKHPNYGFNRILRDGAIAWKRLPSHEKLQYSQKEVLKNYKKRGSITNTFEVFARQPIPMDFHRRSMSTAKNIKRSWRKLDNTMTRASQKVQQYSPQPSLETTTRVTRRRRYDHMKPIPNTISRESQKLAPIISNYRIFARQPSPIPLHPIISNYKAFARQPSAIYVRRREVPQR